MEEVYFFTSMEISIWVILKMIKCMELEYFNRVMGPNMKAIFKMIKNTEMEHFSVLKKNLYTKDNFTTGLDMVKVF